MSKVDKQLKGRGKTRVAYKVVDVVRGRRGLYRPTYKQRHLRWRAGKSYVASYNAARWESAKTGKSVKRWGLYARAIDLLLKTGNALGSKIIPVIGYGSGRTYPCGFHFFTTLAAARSKSGASIWRVVLKCEISEVVAEGCQWGMPVVVARKMRIVGKV